MRELRGPSSDWDLTALLLRRIDLHLAGANWQRGGGKGTRPKPVPVPGDGKASGSRRDPQALQKLRNLGLLDGDGGVPASPTGTPT